MLKTEIAVVGAGPAGLSAACAAREAGAEVMLLDDQPSAGGQLFKQVHKFFGSKAHLAGTRGLDIGQQLLDRARGAGVDIWLNASVVGIFDGPTLAVVGAEVVAVVEAVPTIGGYWVHAAKLRRAGVPILTRHTIQEARGHERVEEAVIVELDEDWQPKLGTEQALAVDTICLAVGLSPSTRLTSLARCEHRWDPARGGHVPIHDGNLETTVPGIYVAGDVAGVEEASTAMEQGRIAGLSAAHALGRLADAEVEQLREEARHRLGALRLPPTLGTTPQREVIGRGGLLSLRAARTGVLNSSDLNMLPGVPSEERMRRGPVAVIECPETIPCDPCVTSCPFGAMILGEDSLTGLPRLDKERCTGCGLCVAHCPGQAVFVVDLTFAPGEATVTFPYEFLPLPQPGTRVQGTDREGKPVVSARVVKVDTRSQFDHTAVVTIAVPVEYAQVVRGIARKET